MGYNYYEQFIEDAERGGMKGVAESEFFAERIAENPANRERLLAMDVQEFIGVMRTVARLLHRRQARNRRDGGGAEGASPCLW